MGQGIAKVAHLLAILVPEVCALIECYDRDKQQAIYKGELANFLNSKHWDYFFTVTNRTERKDSLAFVRDVSRCISRLTRGRAFVAVEPHQSGGIHAHGLIGLPLVAPVKVPAKCFFQEFYDHFGRSKVELCNSRQAVANYCAKYVVKSEKFEYTFLGNSRAWGLTK